LEKLVDTKLIKTLGSNLPKDINIFNSTDFLELLMDLLELKYYDRVSDDIDDIKISK
jgi:hypothetical protein